MSQCHGTSELVLVARDFFSLPAHKHSFICMRTSVCSGGQKTPNKLGRKGHSCAKLAMNRCNVDYYTCAHYSGGMLYQKNQVATDDISQEYIRTNTKILRFSGDCQISKN